MSDISDDLLGDFDVDELGDTPGPVNPTPPAAPPVEVDITNLPRRKSRQYECGNPLPPQVGPRVELRKNDDGTLDEFLIYVGDTCVYHLEQMDDDHWWMAAYLGDERVTVSLSARGKITATVEDERARHD